MRALFLNPAANLEPYLQQLMPPMLTCLVSKRLYNENGGCKENHWGLRDDAAELVALVCGGECVSALCGQKEIAAQRLRSATKRDPRHASLPSAGTG